MTLIPAGCGDIDVRGSDRVEMTSCITEANIKTDQRSVKRYARRKGTRCNNLPRANGVACSQETEKKILFQLLLASIFILLAPKFL